MNSYENKIDILGSKISIWNLSETVEKIIELAMSKKQCKYVCVSNVHTVTYGKNNPEFSRVTNSAALATADGVPLIWASKLLPGPKIHGRASGPDILPLILEKSPNQKLRHFFYGGTPEVLKALELQLKKQFPKTEFVGFYSPSFTEAKSIDAGLTKSEIEDCENINKVNPDIVWVGLGAPKQEIWMYRARSVLQVPVLVGVGAAFDFLSGNKKRAPVWMQKVGLEWFHRLASEPNRLISRYAKTNPQFIYEVIKQVAKASDR